MDGANSRCSEVETGERTCGAVMCETRDLGIKLSHWHTLISSDETRIDIMIGAQEMLKRCWCKEPVQSTGRNGQQSTNMKS